MSANNKDFQEPFPAHMLKYFLFEDDDDDDDNEDNKSNNNINQNFEPKNNLEVDESTDNLLKQLVKDKHDILMANSFNYHLFLQGRALSRISSSVLNLLKHIYNKSEKKTENASLYFDELMYLFETDEEKKDAEYSKEQIILLIKRVIVLKENNDKNDHKFVKATISTSVFQEYKNTVKPVCKRKLQLNVDEVSRLRKIRKRHLEVIKEYIPDLAITEDDDDKEKKKRDLINLKKEERLRREAKRFLKDNEPVDEDLINWDVKKENDDNFDQTVSKNNLNTENDSEITLPSFHRQKLRKELGSYVDSRSTKVKTNTKANLLKQKNFSTLAESNQCIKKICTPQSTNENLLKNSSHFISSINHNKNKNLNNKSIITPLPKTKLKTCIKSNSSTKNKVIRNVKILSKPTLIKYFEIDESNCIIASAAENSSITIHSTTKKFTKKIDSSFNRFDCFNLVNLPHQDAPAPLTKRSNPLLSGQNGLGDIHCNIENKVVKFFVHIEKQLPYCVSRWIICDSLLCEFDKKCLKNTYMTRLCYPNLPNWFLEKLSFFVNNVTQFPRQISCVFIECGYDIELLHSDEDTLIPFQFIHDLYDWFYNNASFGKFISKIKINDEAADDDESTVEIEYIENRIMPIIVVINIPEIGDCKRLFKTYNDKISQYINKLNNMPKIKELNEIKLLDWAELVRSYPNQEKMLKNEDRIRLLIEEMRSSYGVLYR